MRICLDPGHGGHDPGAPGDGDPTEAVANLEVATRLASMLEYRGHEVRMTRYYDRFIDLSDRATIANSWRDDCFISIHCNSHENPGANGAEALYYPGSVKGKALADFVLKSWVRASGLRDRGLKPRRDLAVLRLTKMPAALIELGFLSNTSDERLWGRASENPQFAGELISSLADGIERWCRRYIHPIGEIDVD